MTTNQESVGDVLQPFSISTPQLKCAYAIAAPGQVPDVSESTMAALRGKRPPAGLLHVYWSRTGFSLARWP